MDIKMKTVLNSALIVLAVLATGCASSRVCEVELINKDQCTQFNGMSGGECNAHVTKHKIELKK